MILETEVWCSADDKARDMGLPDGDIWMPIAIDFDKIDTIKEAGSNDFIGEGKATIYVGGVHFIIKMDYKSAVEKWKQHDYKR